MMARLVIALIGLALLVGAMTQVVNPPPAPSAVADCDAPQLDDVTIACAMSVIEEPERQLVTAVWHREIPIGRLAIFAPFRPPQQVATSST